jgi:hypothetical protein
MAAVALSASEQAALHRLAADLRRVFGDRLESVLAYGSDRPLHSLALADRVTFADLAACIPLADDWHAADLATPLLLSRHEFLRTLDVFPVEYGAIIEDHVVIAGASPFPGCTVHEADLRRAVEAQAKSHLIHLREGFLETGGRPEQIARLIAGSAPAYRALLRNLERLDPSAMAGTDRGLVNELSAVNTIAEPSALLARYVAEAERVWAWVDGWK